MTDAAASLLTSLHAKLDAIDYHIQEHSFSLALGLISQCQSAILAALAQPAPAAQEAPSGVVKPMSIYEAVLACPHVIEHEAITLKYDRKQSGHNALSQLAARTRLALADHIAAALAERQPQPQEGMPLVNAARELIAARQSTFKARNGRQVGIQDENGEKCWIVPFDEMFALENAVPAAAPLPSQKEGE